MEHFGVRRLADMTLPMSSVRQLTTLGEMKGKQELWKTQKPEVLETLRQVAVILSTESSNRIENVIVEPERLRALMANATTPQTRSEAEVAGYRDVLQTIHGSWEYMELSPNVILQMHRDLYRYSPQQGGRWKQTNNQITELWPDGTVRIRFAETTPAHMTDQAVAGLCEAFRGLCASGTVDDLVLIGSFVLDFLCIHPFSDGNGRMARLLTLLMLYQSHYQVGHFISLERIIEETKTSYYDSLYRSSQGWNTGQNDLLPWLSYFLGVLTAAYKDFEERVGQADGVGTKSGAVRTAVAEARQPFTMQEIANACPTTSLATIRKVLNQLKAEGRIVCTEKGRNARWLRVSAGS